MVFTTKDRIPFLNSQEIRGQIFEHISNNAKKKNIWLDTVNGHKQHIHCLISLGKEQNISNIAQLIKGESSYWINQNKIVQGKFNWQDDFWAVSVSESHVNAVRNYISNQEEHHRYKSFDEEVEEFMKKYGWNFINVKSK
jgi:REP element-mobilizing transposase RayT